MIRISLLCMQLSLEMSRKRVTENVRKLLEFNKVTRQRLQ